MLGEKERGDTKEIIYHYLLFICFVYYLSLCVLLLELK